MSALRHDRHSGFAGRRRLCIGLLVTALAAGCSDTSTTGDGTGGGFTTTDIASNADGSVPLLDGSATPVSGEVTYYGHTRAILEANCVPCHTPGEISTLYLTTYEAAYQARDAIAFEVESLHMPPWLASPGCDTYSPDSSLSDQDRATLIAWVDEGAPEGFPADYVPPFVDPPVTLDGPSIALVMPEPYTPPAGTDDYRCFPITWTGTVPLYINGAEIVPGSRTQVHHVIAYAAGPEMGPTVMAADMAHEGPGYPCFGSPLPSGSADNTLTAGSFSWVAAWAPGGGARLFPAGTGILIEPGSTVVLQMHYNTYTVEPFADVTTAYFQVVSSVTLPAAVYPFTNFGWVFSPGSMMIPAGEAEVTHSHSDDITGWTGYFPADLGRAPGASMLVHSVALHMHRLGASASVSLRRSNGTEDCLLDIPDWDFDWQRSYQFTDAKIVHAGDLIDLSCTWDNSQANQPWIDGVQATAQDVDWGDGTRDEMCLAVLFVTAMDSTPGVCTPNCGQKQCGSDGCGGTCGDCPAEAPYCDPSTYQCTAQCLPNCALKECGDDGCGGTCGDCPVTAPNCDPSTHQCTSMCIPTCGDEQCGSDGCGGSCGVCPQNAPYCIEGICYADAAGTCLPACDGKNCGADGCGGNCGVCPPNAPTCVGGLCGGICQANCSGKQ
ncbi:MAG: hypothetical protein QF464_11675, partial [Myxococcota bacterium]|nr:hypothetical protein [Myxococcota bacterium]